MVHLTTNGIRERVTLSKLLGYQNNKHPGACYLIWKMEIITYDC